MPILRCQMCGGILTQSAAKGLYICADCRTPQTIAHYDDEDRMRIYQRVNHYRNNGEYERAAGLLNKLLDEDTQDAYAYWLLVLCEYGVEYVEDEKTGNKLPTLNRMRPTSIYADENLK